MDCLNVRGDLCRPGCVPFQPTHTPAVLPTRSICRQFLGQRSQRLPVVLSRRQLTIVAAKRSRNTKPGDSTDVSDDAKDTDGPLSSQLTATLDALNPVNLGRKSRAALEKRLSKPTEAAAQPAELEAASAPTASTDQSGGKRQRKSRGGKAKAGDSVSASTSSWEQELALARREGPVAEAVPEDTFNLNDLNPIEVGRKTRVLFDSAWAAFTQLASPVRSVNLDEEGYGGFATEFDAPQAPDTTVLVVGGTGRVGRVIVRKLLLRSYNVKVLLTKGKTKEEDAQKEELARTQLPSAVGYVFADITNYASAKQALKGIDKVIYCAAAERDVADLRRVEEVGVRTMAQALQAEVTEREMRERESRRKLEAAYAKSGSSSSSPEEAAANDAGVVSSLPQAGLQEARSIVDGANALPYVKQGQRFSRLSRKEVFNFKRVRKYYDRWTAVQYQADGEKLLLPPSATVAIVEPRDGRLVFEGAVKSPGGAVELSSRLYMPHGETLEGSEGLILRVAGDKRTYSCCLYTGGSGRETVYRAKFFARDGFNTIRLPFNIFRPDKAGAPPLEPGRVRRIGVRYDVPRAAGAVKRLTNRTDPSAQFRLELEFVKALQTGVEPDFILVSCAGVAAAGEGAMDEFWRERVTAAKRRGEALLKNVGVGYMVVRPGPMVEEPGGYKALVFDQGNRITQPIAFADVADICLKALHNPAAHNKTFEVCYEYTPDAGLEMYELVAHLPDKANNYLTPALATLEKNT